MNAKKLVTFLDRRTTIFARCDHDKARVDEDESLLQQSGVHLLLASGIPRSLGGSGDRGNVLASVACILGGNVPACYGGWLLCKCGEEPDISLHSYGAALSGSGDSATLVELHAREAYCDMDGRSRGGRNGIRIGVAVRAKAQRCCLEFLISTLPALPLLARCAQKPIWARPRSVRSCSVARPLKSTSKSMAAKSGAERPSRKACFCFGR
jgi:hypothetical protein